ncbi:MAG: SMC family ATPase, partial [Candidatus Thermoplasmatota archaeon]
MAGSRIRSLSLRNYRCFRSLEIEFPDGIVGIIGPNGAGKSTIIEAISWALFGSAAFRTNKEDVRYQGASFRDPCAAELCFELDEHCYRLLREMKGKQLGAAASLEVDGKLMARTDSEVTRYIQNALGMDYVGFFVSLFARQKDLDALSKSSNREREKTVLRLLGIDDVDKAIAALRKDKRESGDKKETLQQRLFEEGRRRSEMVVEEIEALRNGMKEDTSRLESLEADARSLSQELDTMRQELHELGLLRSRHSALGQRLAALRGEIVTLGRELQSLKKEMEKAREAEALVSALMPMEDAYRGLLAEHQRLLSQSKLWEERSALQSKVEHREAEKEKRGRERERLAAEHDELAGAEDRIEHLRKRIEEEKEGLVGLERKGGEVRSRIGALAAELRESEEHMKQIESMGPESLCPLCERRMGEHHSGLMGKLRRQHIALSEDLEKAKDRLSLIEEEIRKKKRGLKSIEKEAETEAERHSTWKRLGKTIRELDRELRGLEDDILAL